MSYCISPVPLKIQVHLRAGKTDETYVYKTTSETRGVVKIINISCVEGLPYRQGSEIDVSNLQSLFEQMGFLVDIHPTSETSHTKEVPNI